MCTKLLPLSRNPAARLKEREMMANWHQSSQRTFSQFRISLKSTFRGHPFAGGTELLVGECLAGMAGEFLGGYEADQAEIAAFLAFTVKKEDGGRADQAIALEQRLIVVVILGNIDLQ